MDTEQNNTLGEEEYRPASYDAVAAQPDSSTETAAQHTYDASNPAANAMQNLSRKTMLTFVGVLVIVFGVYKFIAMLFAPHGVQPHKVNAAAPAVMQKLPQPTVTQSAPTAPAVAAELAVATTSIDNRLVTLEQQSADGQTNLARLSSQVSDLQSTIGDMNNKLSTLTSALQVVADQVVQEQAAAAAQRVARKKAQRMAAMAPKPVYYIKALVPGRAWLVGQDGKTITATLGNNLPGYGTVAVIDSIQGTLTTSSGAVIGYSSGDS